ncbi:MAG: anti-sigma factor family protein [Acidimicrobiales bacterium]
MTQTDPPEFEPDHEPVLGSRREPVPVPVPGTDIDREVDADEDLIRCSRFVDGDLDPDEQRVLEADLAVRGDLRQLLADLRSARDAVRSPITTSDTDLESLMSAVWTRLDADVEDRDNTEATVTPLPSRHPLPLPAAGHATRRTRPPTRRSRAWAPLLQWSAAATVVVAIALVAVTSRPGDDAATDSADSASAAFETNRATGALTEQATNANVQDALSATTTPAVLQDLGGFPSVDALLNVVRTRFFADTAASPTAKVGADDSQGGDSNGTAGELASDEVVGCQSNAPEPTSSAISSGMASVAGAGVQWTVWEVLGGQRIIVVDAVTCAVLADQPA